jgi:hypothetical protein
MRPRRLLARFSIRAKLTLAYTGLIALMLGAIGLFLYFHFESGLDGGLNGTLNARADDVATLVRHEGVGGVRRRGLLAGGDLTAQLLSPAGAVLVTSTGPGAPALLSPAAVGGGGGGKAPRPPRPPTSIAGNASAC